MGRGGRDGLTMGVAAALIMFVPLTAAAAEPDTGAAAPTAWKEGRVYVFELNIGQSHEVLTPDGPHTVKLIDVRHFWESDDWVENNPAHRTLCRADVTVEVDGQRAVLVARPYQPPVTVGGLRLYVEGTRQWLSAGLAQSRGIEGDVRLSCVPAGAAWGPKGMVFPIRDFRWRSATYNNTWSALVPFNVLYYHRGEDYGAIPDQLEVQAPLAGEVIRSPVPEGDGGSNTLGIRTDVGLTIHLAHMNTDFIDPHLVPGTRVQAAQVLGRTGCTWQGRRSQKSDPHVHVSFSVDRMPVSPYPYLVEAYFRTYPDAMLPVAGGYYFAEPGQTVQLDGSRSLARPGRRIVSWTWRLHDGTTVEGPVAAVACPRPGLFSEELIVRTDDGQEDRDFAQVRVYDSARGRDIVYGWAYHTPVRGIRPGTEVRFWNRLANCRGAVTIDYGDGTAAQTIDGQTTHRYDKPGLYVVTLSATGPGDEPATLRFRVVVDP